MARPKKLGLDYFPLDVDFFSDEKIVAIHGEFGQKGPMVAIHLLCAIYRNAHFAQWNEMSLMKIASATGCSAELVQMVVRRLVKWGFFDKKLFHSAAVLTSAGIQRRYFTARKWRDYGPETPYLLVSAPKPPVSAPKPRVLELEMPQKKENNKKCFSPNVEKHKEAPPPTPGVNPPDGSLWDELKASSVWAEALCMKHGLEMPRLLELIDAFAAHCREHGKDHQTPSEAKNHFAFWLPKRLDGEKTAGKQSATGKGRSAPATPTPAATPPAQADYTFNGGFGGQDV